MKNHSRINVISLKKKKNRVHKNEWLRRVGINKKLRNGVKRNAMTPSEFCYYFCVHAIYSEVEKPRKKKI